LEVEREGGIAQLVERLLCKQDVSGSNPLTSTKERKKKVKSQSNKIQHCHDYERERVG
jgi:hypothetical protein